MRRWVVRDRIMLEVVKILLWKENGWNVVVEGKLLRMKEEVYGVRM